MKKTLLFLIILSVFFAGSVFAKEKPNLTELAEISTKAGKLRFYEESGKRFFNLNGDVLLSGSTSLDIYKFLRTRNTYDALLVKDFTGPIACPLQYRFMVIRPDGTSSVFKPFNHCDDKPETSLKGDKIKITYRKFGDQPAVSYLLDGRRLLKVKNMAPEEKPGKKNSEVQ